MKCHKNWCFQTLVLVKTPESPLGSREMKPVNLKGNQPWIFAGRTDAEAPRLCHLIWRANSLEIILMVEKIEGKRKRGWQDEMVGWHHCLNGHEFEQTQGDSERGREAWRTIVHGVAKNQTQLSDWTRATTASGCWEVKVGADCYWAWSFFCDNKNGLKVKKKKKELVMRVFQIFFKVVLH